MDIFRFFERLMSMNDAAWARHANPMSVGTRMTCLPLLVLAIWSRDWIGWWSLIPIALAVLWTWYNPRAFGPPRTTDNWASKGTFGERIFLNRRNIPIPRHHQVMAKVLSAASAVGMVVLVYSLIVLAVWAAVCGLVLLIGSKLWFVDRMVWLYDDMKDADPDYAGWLKT